ncbi:hypothetical protein AOL_s00091g47 [Orbilia oligospora ATCC 24927]|uniref:Uncharacterized protein n=1 Tax=Arthrobotrys oligospora (strain ATCC 24927 / CBS 115.81 / DSM 1491) TaxID=756982 RepID=G1XHZ5_ARTOA|nr:hypothetical protein AOL_s00091g47 [Orbilia oligospora ATCC 24927]EGX47226.1 hypothetical protein AOL_s00091g47 [Orbilia oligospora ATCC 24927]
MPQRSLSDIFIINNRLIIPPGAVAAGTRTSLPSTNGFQDELQERTTQTGWGRVGSGKGQLMSIAYDLREITDRALAFYDLLISTSQENEINGAQVTATDFINLSPASSFKPSNIPDQGILLSTVFSLITDLTIFMDGHDTQLLMTALKSLGSLAVLHVTYPIRRLKVFDNLAALVSPVLPLKVLRITGAPPCRLTDLAVTTISPTLQILEIAPKVMSDPDTLLTETEMRLACKMIYGKLLIVIGGRDVQQVRISVCHLTIDENCRVSNSVHTWRRVSGSQLEYSVRTIEVKDAFTKMVAIKRMDSSRDRDPLGIDL